MSGTWCVCAAGYVGAHCEVELDECDPHPCGVGRCVDQVNGSRAEAAKNVERGRPGFDSLGVCLHGGTGG